MKRYSLCMTAMLLAVVALSTMFGISSAADIKPSYSTLEEFDAQYPPYNENAVKQEATNLAEEKFKPVKMGDEINVRPT